ncbi:hypothetical protein IC229_22920 [Spirosoma sp. BT702]|uniref:DUF1573 domain-containing protein n=1 Tax=Spirosoma profusum TaxID=2771354 RepID=A0A926Y086_9BACT|nr:hypothetical protein [Spirosoma profusum]MBD2703516.1 hypothetical protein [Spirosoma profusum]
MKNLIFLIALLLSKLTLSFGQCDKDVTLTSSKTEYLDGSGTVHRTDDEESTIAINKTQITITPGNPDRKMVGTIQSTTCNWPTAYQEGKTVIKVVFQGPSDAPRHATMTIEGKAGKITFLMEIDEMPDKKIRVNVTSFKETKKE